jgi:hypothetical protein
LTYDDLGKTVFEGFMTVSPEGKAEVIVTYTLPESINQNGYSVLVQKQPGEETEQLQVEVSGKNTKKIENLLEKIFRV